ncbi:hypothetical protein EDC04DRAFT_3097040 [Pisolithus marmoratus]|nr:hypothetical protein EDC04DRAFT_3097040 [Pisolithus marmoratus]
MLIALFVMRPVPLPATHPRRKDGENGDYELIPSGEVVPSIADPDVDTSLKAGRLTGYPREDAMDDSRLLSPLHDLIALHSQSEFRSVGEHINHPPHIPRAGHMGEISSDDHARTAHLSENLGYLSLPPLIGGNVFSIIFGRNLDAHTLREGTNESRGVALRDVLSERRCFTGRECYVSSLKVTLMACMVALALSMWAARRDRHRQKARKG